MRRAGPIVPLFLLQPFDAVIASLSKIPSPIPSALSLFLSQPFRTVVLTSASQDFLLPANRSVVLFEPDRSGHSFQTSLLFFCVFFFPSIILPCLLAFPLYPFLSSSSEITDFIVASGDDEKGQGIDIEIFPSKRTVRHFDRASCRPTE